MLCHIHVDLGKSHSDFWRTPWEDQCRKSAAPSTHQDKERVTWRDDCERETWTATFVLARSEDMQLWEDSWKPKMGRRLTWKGCEFDGVQVLALVRWSQQPGHWSRQDGWPDKTRELHATVKMWLESRAIGAKLLNESDTNLIIRTSQVGDLCE